MSKTKSNTLNKNINTQIAVSEIVSSIVQSITETGSHFAETFNFKAQSHSKNRNNKKARFNSNAKLPSFENMEKSKLLKVSGGIIALLLSVWGIAKITQQASNSSATASDQQEITVAGPTASTQLNQEYSFPLKDGSGETVADLIYEISSAELRDEIIVKGKRARVAQGRTFLILNLKIKNDFNQAIEIDSRDYVRLIINGNEEEQLAPEIHNDPVEVQAISLKNTRLGFTIDDSFESLSLKVGEIAGDKETIDLSF